MLERCLGFDSSPLCTCLSLLTCSVLCEHDVCLQGVGISSSPVLACRCPGSPRRYHPPVEDATCVGGGLLEFSHSPLRCFTASMWSTFTCVIVLILFAQSSCLHVPQYISTHAVVGRESLCVAHEDTETFHEAPPESMP